MTMRAFTLGAVLIGSGLLAINCTGSNPGASAPNQSETGAVAGDSEATARTVVAAPVKPGPKPDPSTGPGGGGYGGGPGACNATDCLAGKHACVDATCIKPPGAANPVCEYRNKWELSNSTCRCVPGDVRPCTKSGGVSGTKTCSAAGGAATQETVWSACN